MKKANYGIDAPGVIRNLLIVSAIGFLLPAFFPQIRISEIVIYTSGFRGMGFSCGIMGVWMLMYSLYGKLKHRDKMLSMITWKGNENVLDVGTGRGLLMIGAAQKLSTGKSIGIDVWNTEDLTKNTFENAIRNAEAEGLRSKIEILNENAMQMSFSNESFDVVLSNMCLHNIYSKEGRKKACLEIARVLKDGGTALISDFKNMAEYKRNFKEAGCKTNIIRGSFVTTFPPLSILEVKK